MMKDGNRKFDVAIVGGGPAGITAAAALGKKGYSTIVLEAGVYPGAENWSGTVYFAENLVHEDAFGPDLFEEAPYERKLVKRGFSLYDGISIFGSSYRNEETFRNCYTVLRPIFDRYLSERVKEWGVSVLPETTVQSLIREKDRIIGCQTERGPVYADCVFLAEGDASHLTTQEGYERIERERPEFLQGIKEVIELPPDLIEERFGVNPGEGSASEVLIRNGNIGGETARLNMGAFIYTNRDSISLGLVLPVDNLKEEFDGDHNDLMEWFKGLPEIRKKIRGGRVTSFGTKIIRGGGYRECPQIVDDGLAIGGAATGIGLDFPYPNFTGPATRMGLLFARAYDRIRQESGNPDRETLEKTYLNPLKETHYYKNVRYLKDFPSYVKKTGVFFERQIDLVSGTASIVTNTDLSQIGKLRSWVRLLRNLVSGGKWRELISDRMKISSIFGIPGHVWSNLDAGMLCTWLMNSFQSLLPGAPRPRQDEGELDYHVSTDGEQHSADQVPSLFQWIGRRFHEPLKEALEHVYRNDETPIEEKVNNATRALMSGFSFLDLLLLIPSVALVLVLLVFETVTDYIRFRILKHDVSEFLNRPEQKHLQKRRSAGRMNLEQVEVSKDEKLGTISYFDTEQSNIKVFWPEELQDRKELEDSPLWHVCPARVYDVHTQFLGNPGVVVNFENCIKCETCWRATEDVHWSRATEHRMIYETYSPSHVDLVDYLRNRSLPEPNLPDESLDPDAWIEQQEKTLREVDPEFSFTDDPDTISGLQRIPAKLKRLRIQLRSLPEHIEDLPPVLEQGRKRWLNKYMQSIEQVCDDIDVVLKGKPLLELRRQLHGSEQTTFYSAWDELMEQIDRMRGALQDDRPFWTSLIGDKILDHHLPRFETSIEPLLRNDHIEPEQTLLPEQLRDIRTGSTGRFAPGEQEFRQAVRTQLRETFEHQDIKGIERGASLNEEQRSILKRLVTDLPLRERVNTEKSRVLVEELSRLDPSLGWIVSHHLWGIQLLREAGVSQEVMTPYLEFDHWLAVSCQHDLNMVNVSDEDNATAHVTGSAEFVPCALAGRFLLPVEDHLMLFERGDQDITFIEENPCGLKGAKLNRVKFEQCETEHVWSLESNQNTERWQAVLEKVVPYYTDITRGGSEYLLQRAKDHAESRVQFPGQFQDEAGKDSIAKFGSVKEMLADMEEQRYLLETLSTLSRSEICPEYPEVASVVRRVLAGSCFGPEIGSFGYNAGQIFGGTAFSEDDFIAKFYRDSSVTRFLIRDPDRLMEWLGNQWISVQKNLGNILSHPSEMYGTLHDCLDDEPLLSDVRNRFKKVRKKLDDYLNDVRSADEPMAQSVCIQSGELIAGYLSLRSGLLRAYLFVVRGENVEKEVQACEKAAMDLLSSIRESLGNLRRKNLTRQAGEQLLEHGPFEPVPSMNLPHSYSEFLDSDQQHHSGQSLIEPYDASSPRHSPELAANDSSLSQFADQLREEVREKYYSETYTEGTFDGRCYPRYLEEIHTLPDEDLEYLRENGYLRIPIDRKYGGEGHLKASYYQLCDTFMRFADPAMALCIMVNTSIGTTPIQLGLKQDLPAAERELSNYLDNPDQLSEIAERIDRILDQLDNPDPAKLKADFEDCEELVRDRIRNSNVLKYIAGGFLRTFYDAARAGQEKDLDGFQEHLDDAREQFDRIEAGIQEKIDEFGRRKRAHERHLRMISAGWVSAFALTEPTAGSDSGGVKTRATLERARVHRDEQGLPYFFVGDDDSSRRNLLDATSLTFDAEHFHTGYRWDEDRDPARLHFDEYDYEKDRPDGKKRYILVDGEKHYFHDIGLVRTDEKGREWYEYYVLNGSKMWITNGRFASMFNLYARTEEGVSGFMVDRHAEGLVVGQDEDKMGQKGSPTNELSLKNVRVPRENVIGIMGRGQVNALESLNAGRIGLAYCSSGIMKDIVERGKRYLTERNENGRQTKERVQHLFGRMAENVMATESLSYDLVGFVDHPETDSIRMESAVGKYFASEAVHETINYGEHLRGAESQTARHDIEKKRRDARVITIYEGTNEVQRFLLLKDLVQDIQDQSDVLEDAAPDESHYPDLLDEIQERRHSLHELLEDAVSRFGDQVWQQVSYQPVFFRLSEIAGLLKLMFSTLQRMDLVKERENDPGASQYAELVEKSGRLFIERALCDLSVKREQYSRRYDFLRENRYPPQIQLGFQSLERDESTGDDEEEPERDVSLDQSLHIAVSLKPVPMTAPEPRLDDGEFVEPLQKMNPADRAALEEALALKSAHPGSVRVTAAVVGRENEAGMEPILRRALSLGADRAVKFVNTDGPITSQSVAGALSEGVQKQMPDTDLFFLGSKSADTAQGAVAPLLAEQLGFPHFDEVGTFASLSDSDDELRWRVGIRNGGERRHVHGEGKAVFAFQERDLNDDFRIEDALRSWSSDIEEVSTSVSDPFQEIVHRTRRLESDQDEEEKARDPESAAKKILDLTGLSESGSGEDVEAYGIDPDEVPPLDERTRNGNGMFVSPPLTAGTFERSVTNLMRAGKQLASEHDMGLTVFLPSTRKISNSELAIGQIADIGVEEVIFWRDEDLGDYSWHEFRSLLSALSDELPEVPELWMGTDKYRDAFCRFQNQVEGQTPDNPGDTTPLWFFTQQFSTRNGTCEFATPVMEGAVEAVARMDRDRAKMVTFGDNVRVADGTGTETETDRTAPDVYRFTSDFRIESKSPYPPVFGPAASDGSVDGLEEADVIIDVGYGVGDAEGMKSVVDPLKELLQRELELDGVMVGATRKVTQDLELLPNERQIGQTGTRVQPDLLFALGVSGAPQHIDYISEETTIFAFNIDGDAPLMRLNEERPAPVVHPIEGDLFETVPEFIDAVRRQYQAS